MDKVEMIIIYSEEYQRANIKFSGIPAEEVRTELKQNGWFYSKNHNVWYPKNAAAATSNEFAKKLKEKYFRDEEKIEIVTEKSEEKELLNMIKEAKPLNEILEKMIQFYGEEEVVNAYAQAIESDSKQKNDKLSPENNIVSAETESKIESKEMNAELSRLDAEAEDMERANGLREMEEDVQLPWDEKISPEMEKRIDSGEIFGTVQLEDDTGLTPEMYEKEQDRIKKEYEEKKIPYVVLNWSESPIFPQENKVYTVKEFNEILLQADSEFHNRKKYAEEKYGSADNYWNLERDDKLPEEDKGIRFGYDKTNFKFFNIPNPNNPEDTFSYEPSRYDIGDGNGSVFDYVRSTCSHDEFIEALNALETQLYFPGVTDSQRQDVEKTVEEATQNLKATLKEKMEDLDKAQNEYKELHKKWLIEATEADRVDEMLKNAVDGVKDAYDRAMNDVFTKVLNEYPFASGDVAGSEFLKYIANEVKKMAVSELYLPSRNAQKAMNADDYKSYNSTDWEKLRRIWEKFPANVNMTAYVEKMLQDKCNEKGMSVPENTKAVTPPETTTEVHTDNEIPLKEFIDSDMTFDEEDTILHNKVTGKYVWLYRETGGGVGKFEYDSSFNETSREPLSYYVGMKSIIRGAILEKNMDEWTVFKDKRYFKPFQESEMSEEEREEFKQSVTSDNKSVTKETELTPEQKEIRIAQRKLKDIVRYYDKWYHPGIDPMVDEIMAEIGSGNKEVMAIVQNFDLNQENVKYKILDENKLLPKMYEKVQDRIKKEYEEKKIPYVVMYSSGSPKFPSQNKVYTVKEFNEILLPADSEFYNRKKYAEEKYSSAANYWNLERDDKLPEEDKGIRFGYTDRTNFKFFNIPDPNNPENTFSYEPVHYDFGDGNGSVFDFVRSTCSHDGFIEAFNALETQLYFPGVADSQRQFVEKTVEEANQNLKATLKEKMEDLDKAQNENSDADRVEEMLKNAVDGVKDAYDSSMNDVFTKVLGEYPFASGDVAGSEFLGYTANEVKKMVISELYLPTRNAMKAMNGEDHKTYNSTNWENNWEILSRIWKKFPANVNMTAYVEKMLQDKCNEKGMSVPENTKVVTPPETTTEVHSELTPEDIELCKKVIPPAQFNFTMELTEGEEGEFFRNKMKEIADTYRRINTDSELINEDGTHTVGFRYFLGDTEIFLSEIDSDGIGFGYNILNGDLQMSEWGSTSLEEIMKIPYIEMDYHVPEGITIEKMLYQEHPEYFAEYAPSEKMIFDPTKSSFQTWDVAYKKPDKELGTVDGESVFASVHGEDFNLWIGDKSVSWNASHIDRLTFIPVLKSCGLSENQAQSIHNLCFDDIGNMKEELFIHYTESISLNFDEFSKEDFTNFVKAYSTSIAMGRDGDGEYFGRIKSGKVHTDIHIRDNGIALEHYYPKEGAVYGEYEGKNGKFDYESYPGFLLREEALKDIDISNCTYDEFITFISKECIDSLKDNDEVFEAAKGPLISWEDIAAEKNRDNKEISEESSKEVSWTELKTLFNTFNSSRGDWNDVYDEVMDEKYESVRRQKEEIVYRLLLDDLDWHNFDLYREKNILTEKEYEEIRTEKNEILEDISAGIVDGSITTIENAQIFLNDKLLKSELYKKVSQQLNQDVSPKEASKELSWTEIENFFKEIEWLEFENVRKEVEQDASFDVTESELKKETIDYLLQSTLIFHNFTDNAEKSGSSELSSAAYEECDSYSEELASMILSGEITSLENAQIFLNDKILNSELYKKISQQLNQEVSPKEAKPYNFYVIDVAELDFGSDAEIDPITGLTAEKAVLKYAELKEKGIDASIGLHIPEDIVFDRKTEDGLGAVIFTEIEGKHSFYIGDHFVKNLSKNDEHAKNVIAAYKELYENADKYILGVEKPNFLFDKEAELNRPAEPLKVYTFTPFGYEGSIVQVETDLRRGIPAYDIVGLADSAVKETRERIRSAFTRSDLDFPAERVLQALSPADLRKDSPMNLAMAIGILGQTKQYPVTEPVLALGELELSGNIRPVRGSVAAVNSAKAVGITNIVCDPKTAELLKDIDGIKILTAESLKEANEKLMDVENFQKTEPKLEKTETVQFNEEWMEDYKEALENLPMAGHFETIRAIEIAVAGKHNILATGAPGCGKTLLTQTLMPALTPKMTEEESKQITRINSLAGLDSPKRDKLVPPFRMPHHTATVEGICGGGPSCRPGEVSLAHQGTLFMDETSEFRTSVIQLLRVPLESRQITLSRAGRSTNYPADFQLAMAMSPCPCGCFGSHDKICLDSARSLELYWKKISDPLLDRIEIKTFVQKDEKDTRKMSIDELKAQIATAYEIQRKRGVYNSHMTPEEIQQYCKLDKEGKDYLDKEEDKLTPREVSNLLKLSLTIANMDGREEIRINDLKEARELSAPVFEKPKQFVYTPEIDKEVVSNILNDAQIPTEELTEGVGEIRNYDNKTFTYYSTESMDGKIVSLKSSVFDLTPIEDEKLKSMVEKVHSFIQVPGKNPAEDLPVICAAMKLGLKPVVKNDSFETFDTNMKKYLNDSKFDDTVLKNLGEKAVEFTNVICKSAVEKENQKTTQHPDKEHSSRGL